MASMPGPELTVYIVEDSAAVMQRLTEAVHDIPNARVVGVADTAEHALTGMIAARPRVLILDLHLRASNGFQVLRQLEAGSRPEAVIVITNYSSQEYRQACHEHGADHFFDKAQEFNKVRDLLLVMGDLGDEPDGSRRSAAQS